MSVRPQARAALLAVALSSGCAHRPATAPVAVAAPPAAVPPRPVLAAGLGAIVPPPRAADGRYLTINSNADADRTMWHLRAALNVAAIGCRAPEDAGIVPAYNAVLANEKAVLARANTQVQAGFRKAGGDWQGAHDGYMTRLYNYFAMPAAKAEFCVAARTVAPEAAVATPATFPAFAAAALPRLEAPFVAVFAAIDQWKIETAAWDARYGPGAAPATAVAAATPAPAGPAPAAPQLRYAEIATVIAWAPEPGARLAAR